MPSLQYFFNTYPPTLLPSSVTIALAMIGISAALTVLLFIVARMLKHDPPRRRFLMRLVQWCATATCIVLLLYFFRQQRVYLLSAPAIAVGSLGALLVWLTLTVKTNVRRMREDEKIKSEQEMRKKYLT